VVINVSIITANCEYIVPNDAYNIRLLEPSAPLYPLQDFKVLYKYCIIIIKKRNFLTLMLKPPNITPFICSTANDAASGISYSINAKPLCFLRTVSYGRLIDLMGPNGRKACFTMSSWIAKLIEPTYILTSHDTNNTILTWLVGCLVGID